jgi:hypothetical protein
MLSTSTHRRDLTSATRIDALGFGQHSYGGPKVISKPIAYAKLLVAQMVQRLAFTSSRYRNHVQQFIRFKTTRDRAPREVCRMKKQLLSLIAILIGMAFLASCQQTGSTSTTGTTATTGTVNTTPHRNATKTQGSATEMPSPIPSGR